MAKRKVKGHQLDLFLSEEDSRQFEAQRAFEKHMKKTEAFNRWRAIKASRNGLQSLTLIHPVANAS